VRRVAAAVALAALVAACTTSTADVRSAPAAPGPEPAESAAASSPSADPAPADPAPEASPSPSDARSRTRFAGRLSTIPAAVEAEMRGTTWRAGCPVPLAALRLLTFNYWGLDGEIKRGPMVVNAAVAEDVLWVFRQLFEERFPLKRVGLAREFRESRLETHPDSHRSVTASFNCRVVVTPAGAGDEFSQHAYGLAVDVNPLQNPFVRSDGWVRNRFARPYVDRSRDLPGMIHEGDVVVRAFAAIGWAWGGRWSDDVDYMHFSLAGR
jgi:D-alanyl-D-alanine carboxypeptidase